MKNVSLLCALVAAAFQLSASVAFAAGVPLSPGPNETVNTSQPTMTWTVPDGETVSDILISNSKHNDNGFLDHAIDDGQVTGKTSYHYTGSILIPGDYYWQLSGVDADGNPAASKIQHFIVPAIIQFSPVKAKWARTSTTAGRWTSSSPPSAATSTIARRSLEGLAGDKLLATETSVPTGAST